MQIGRNYSLKELLQKTTTIKQKRTRKEKAKLKK
jgi:hypothetical protein